MVALGFLIKIKVLFALVIVDMLLNSISPTVQNPIYAKGILIGLHVSCVLAQAGVLYAMVSRTIMFRAGLFTGVLRLTVQASLVGVVHLAFLITAYALRFYAIAQRGGNSAGAWNLPYYWVIFFIQQTVSIAHYVSVMRNGVKLCDSRLYLTSTRTAPTNKQ